MANGLFEPAECESERTVIISELQGGENDPDQLLDTEVTASAFRAHPYRHPTIGWLDDLRSMSRDDLLRSLPPVLHSEQRHARRRRRCRCRRGLPVRGEALRIDPRRADARAAACHGASANRRTAGAHRARRHDQLREDGLPCPGGHGRGLLSFARPRCGAHRCKGSEPLVQFPRRAAAAKSPPVYGAGRGPARVDGVGGLACRRARPSSIRFRSPPGGGALRRPRSGGASSARVRADRQGSSRRVDRARKRQLRARLVFENDSVTNIAHQLGYFETVVGPEFVSTLQRRIDAVTLEQVWDVARRRLDPSTKTVGVFRPVTRAGSGIQPPRGASDDAGTRPGPGSAPSHPRQRRCRHRPGDGSHACRGDQRARSWPAACTSPSISPDLLT